MTKLKIGHRWIGEDEPTFFIADISANHDGDIERAKKLIHLSARSGADAAKFQNFRAPKIVSEAGFEALGSQMSHQSNWRKSVFEVYQDASLPWEWTKTLMEECGDAGIEYLSTPYDVETVDMLDPFVNVFKIGSGDISWLEILEKISSKGKPVMLATGASDIGDVQRAVDTIQRHTQDLVLMQCNTDYTGSAETFHHLHLNVLKTYRAMFPDVILGLSDHSPGHAAVLGAVALGARVVEKHFTDDTSREGPDHPFSMDPESWREMVERTRELENALGDGNKRVAENEKDTVIIQRRCLRAVTDLESGSVITRNMIDVLRPAPLDSIPPYEIDKVCGKHLTEDLKAGDCFQWDILTSSP